MAVDGRLELPTGLFVVGSVVGEHYFERATNAANIRVRVGRMAVPRPWEQALARAPKHAMARVLSRGAAALARDAPAAGREGVKDGRQETPGVDEAMAHAGMLVTQGQADEAAGVVCQALETAPPGNAGWLLPIDPLLRVYRDRGPWQRALALLDGRAGTWLAAAALNQRASSDVCR